jgi:Ca-activated chloride channel family protein
MRQHNDSAAIEQFSNAAVMTTDKAKRALSYHNIGVLYQQKKKYKEAISAYQDALRNNPKDNDTRYNFVLCKRLLKQQQQQQQQQQNKNNSDNQQNQDKQDQKQQDQDKNKNQQNSDKQQQQQPKEQMSKENAEQLLNAAMQEEKATQERLKKAMQQPQRRKLDKNW